MDEPSLHFPGGIVGFPTHQDYLLGRLPEKDGVEPDGIFILASLRDPDVRFVVADPAGFFPDYAPEIDDETVETLELTDAADALLLVVLTLGKKAEDATANLRAPLVIHKDSGRAVQAVLTGSAYTFREPLVPAA